MSALIRFARFAGMVLALLLAAAPARAEQHAGAKEPGPDELIAGIVRIKTKAVPGARTAPFLGSTREGTGVVIDAQGLVLTIGYLIVEADSVEVTGTDGRTVPATVVAYDHATGFGLLRPTLPLAARPIELGNAAELAEKEPVVILPHGGQDAASLAFVVSRRPFTGSWEYLLDSAIFTSPPTPNWSGSALINRRGQLVGIGSLFVRNSAEDDEALPGNMFVPIDLLKPILRDLIASGRPSAPARPWLGLSTEEVQGRLFVTRVSEDGPAARAGVKRGDIVVGVGDEPVSAQAEFYRKVWRAGPAGVEVRLKVLQGASVNEVHLKSIDRLDWFKPRPTY